MAYVYRHIRLDKNVPFYIGISNENGINYARANSRKYGRNKHWLNVIDKTEYEIEILFDNIDYNYAKEKEIEFIELYKRIEDGGTLVNLTKGGDGVLGFKNPKLSERNKKGIWKGKKHTEEWKRMMSVMFTGRKISEEQKKKLSILRKGIGIGISNPRYTGSYLVYKDDVFMGEYPLMKDVLDKFGISFTMISLAVNGKREKSKGYVIKKKLINKNK